MTEEQFTDTDWDGDAIFMTIDGNGIDLVNVRQRT